MKMMYNIRKYEIISEVDHVAFVLFFKFLSNFN